MLGNVLQPPAREKPQRGFDYNVNCNFKKH